MRRAAMYIPTVIVIAIVSTTPRKSTKDQPRFRSRFRFRELTVSGEALDNSTDDHDTTAAEDGPTTTEGLVDVGDERQREACAQRVRGSDDSLKGALGIAKIC